MDEPSQNASRPDCSIVLPVYYNEENLENTMASIKKDVIDANPGHRFEVVFVDDGSGDRSVEVLLRLREAQPRLVKVITLTRNFGQVGAVQAGLAHSRGRYVVVMSADGQDPARLVNAMLRAHEQEGYELVICARENRDESFYRRFTSRVFYSLMRKLSFAGMPTGGFDFLSLSRRALDVLESSPETHPFFQGQVLWTGFEPKIISYQRERRIGGQSRWTLGKKLTYLIDGVLSYSYLPLRVMSLAGITVALLGFLYAVLILLAKIAGNVPIEGWAPLMVIVLTLGGLQMLMIGVIGEYLWRTLAQARNRAPYVIDKVYDETQRAAP